MKKIFFLFFAVALTAGAKAQLAGTKWSLTIKMNDQDVPTYCTFTKDTLNVTVQADGSMIETMVYSVKDGVLTIQKTSGESDCDATAIGKYTIEMKDKAMMLKVVSDDCPDRSGVLDKCTMTKQP